MDNRVFAQSGEFVLRAVGRDGVLVPIRNRVGDLDSIYTLTPVAIRIWSLIDGRTAAAEIVAKIAEEYDVSPDIAARDVAELLDAFVEAGLIRLGS